MREEINTILAEYADAATQPGGTRLADWVKRYPEHEQELVEFAVYERVMESRAPYGNATAEDEAYFLSRARVVRERMMAERGCAPVHSLLETAKTVGLNAAALAERLGIGRAEVAKLERRLFRAASIPAALVERLAETIQRPFVDVAAYLRRPPTLSAQASYKAEQAPRIAAQEDFGKAVEASLEMSAEQKAVWRSEMNRTLTDEE